MSGRPKMKIYQYDQYGKYIGLYNSIQEARSKYYINNIGKIPMFTSNEFHFLPDNTVLSKNRVGREKVKFEFKIKDNPLLKANKTKHSDKPIEIFDLLGCKIAEFKDIKTASVLTEMSISKIINLIKRVKHKNNRFNKLGIDIRFK